MSVVYICLEIDAVTGKNSFDNMLFYILYAVSLAAVVSF